MSGTSRPGTGYSVWRLIAEELRAEIAEGRLPIGARLAVEHELAERFAVNRHTVRQALAALAEEGLVATRRGSGTFVTGAPPHVHRIGVRTRLSESLGELARLSRTVVIDSREEAAPPEVREQLVLGDAPALRLETVRSVGSEPIALGTQWFDAARFGGIAAAIARAGSVTAGLRELGVDDYLRTSTTIGARHATAAEASLLRLGPGAVVLVARAVDSLLDGRPLQFALTRFAAQRVQLDVENPVVDGVRRDSDRSR